VPAPAALGTLAAFAGFLEVVPIAAFDGFDSRVFFTVFFFMAPKNSTRVVQRLLPAMRPKGLCGFARVRRPSLMDQFEQSPKRLPPMTAGILFCLRKLRK
jgi:hypothetical protein